MNGATVTLPAKVLDGIEASRRAGWAKYYDAVDEDGHDAAWWRTKSDRDPVVEVGKRTRSAISRFMEVDGSWQCARILLALVDLLSSRSRWWDFMYVGQIAAKAYGVDRAVPWQIKKTRDALRRLDQAGVVFRETPIGHGRAPWKFGFTEVAA